jgi:hypothetical protein
MPKWSPCKRQVFIRRLRALGFRGMFSGSRHQFMVFGRERLTVPSNDEFSVPQLRMMLREVGAILDRDVGADEWSKLS